jgi:single-strand DNA-binding protein
MGYNKVILMGRLVASPTIKDTTSGKTVSRFSLAVEREFSKEENGKRKVDFHKIVAWGALAEYAATYFHKGDPCLVEGELQNRSWDENGNKRYMTEVEARKIRFCLTKAVSENKPEDGSGNVAPSYGLTDEEAYTDVADDEELPF